MLEALLPVSLLVIAFGITLSVYEEWAERGLTDTSYLSLASWAVGLLGVSVWGIVEQDSWVFVVTIAPAGLYLYWIILKANGRLRRRRHRG